MNLQNLTPEQKAALLKELETEKAAEKAAIADNRKAYKELVNTIVPDLFANLKAISERLSVEKKHIQSELSALIKLKADAYGREEEQDTHSFTTDNGITIMIGYRLTDGWDDTATAGIKKVHDFLGTMAKDDNSKKLVNTIMQLLSKDKSGNLKASRVLQLKKLAEDIGDKNFIDAINIIQDAYRPIRSKAFVTCRYKNEIGEAVDLPLSITEA